MNSSIKIGKFTLESLTTGMYSDPKIIFREYIQNSTDSIDSAFNNGLLNSIEDGRIEIELNNKKKQVVIRDNGTGIPSDKTWNTLCDIGDSDKDINTQRGFRGIGRLGGLSYAEKLYFITSAKGENTKSIVVWDCNRLKELLKPNEHKNYDLISVINEVATITYENEDSDKHYFEVRLSPVTDGNEELLDEKVVRDYLSQVTPIPFHANYFFFYNEPDIGIKKYMSDLNKRLEEYNIYLNNDPNPIYKPYKTYFKAGKGESEKKDDIREIKFFKEYDDSGNLIFWGWYSISGFLGYIKDESIAGLRVRKNNILIGNALTLDDFFTQSRFNKWFVGEVYVYDNNLVPNARRDDFEKNSAYYEFKNKLEKYTKNELSKLPSLYSNYNSSVNKISKLDDIISGIEEKIKNGVASETERQKLHKQRDDVVPELIKSKQTLEKVKDKIDPKLTNKLDDTLIKASKLEEKTKKLENGLIDADYHIDKNKELSGYGKNEKKLVIKIFEIIDKELDSEIANKLQKIIIEELKNKRKK